MFQCIILLIYIYKYSHRTIFSQFFDKQTQKPSYGLFSTHMYNEGHPIYACVCLGGLH